MVLPVSQHCASGQMAAVMSSSVRLQIVCSLFSNTEVQPAWLPFRTPSAILIVSQYLIRGWWWNMHAQPVIKSNFMCLTRVFLFSRLWAASSLALLCCVRSSLALMEETRWEQKHCSVICKRKKTHSISNQSLLCFQLEGRTSGLIVLYVVGSITTMIAILGAYGAHKESRVCLIVVSVEMRKSVNSLKPLV